ncbi:hypothetical protein [Thalassovita taeanensis]|uniref:Sulfotransferase family protein n=1 Tax=Thalassovita taeanensis TaxID=657014 RepID=A0A1H8YRY4_9RHOB|nr:hypothetical protein [Thalassovita taeanensis]SEP54940.1 hypothetical protein SAMN04488092_10129 [Thalassovita taeanensis]
MIPADFATPGLHIASNGTPPTRFQVLGERSSGTNYVKRLLGRNTPLRPTEALGWKHGPPHALAIPADLIVIVAVRHAAHWARSMHAKPWHTPAAIQQLTFSDFIRAPWHTIIDRERYFQPEARLGILGQPLQLDRDPATGLAYDDLFALRQGKLRGHLSFANRGCSFVLVRMETAIADPAGFLEQMRQTFALPTPDGPLRPVVKRLGSKFKPAIEPRPETPAILSSDDMAFLRGRLDLSQEQALGYSY